MSIENVERVLARMFSRFLTTYNIYTVLSSSQQKLHCGHKIKLICSCSVLDSASGARSD